jgi:hypothetical protein
LIILSPSFKQITTDTLSKRNTARIIGKSDGMEEKQEEEEEEYMQSQGYLVANKSIKPQPAKGYMVEKREDEEEEEEQPEGMINLLQRRGYRVEKTKSTSKCEE